jgi:hypothetical protein
MADDNDHDDEIEQAVEISIEPRNQAGVWANFARVNHSEHEFTIDFVRLDFASRPVTGIVVARVAVSPLFITQLIGALNDNWGKYAQKAMPKEVRGDDDPN